MTIASILKKFAKPPAPETRCLRVAELDCEPVNRDDVVLSRTGEPLLPVESLPQPPETGSRIYSLDKTDSAADLETRRPVLRLQAETYRQVKNSKYLGDHLVTGADGTHFLLADELPKCFSRNTPYSYLSLDPRAGLDDRNLPSFDKLSKLQQTLLGDPDYAQKRWSTEFTPRQMKAFMVLTTLWEHPEIYNEYSRGKGQQPLDQQTLDSLRLKPEDLTGITLGSIHTDRKHFEVTLAGSPDSMERLKTIFGDADTQAKGEPTERGYLADKPYEPFHPDTQAGGGRSPNSHYSLQFMLGHDHGAADLDMFQPLHLPSETGLADKRKAFFRHWVQHWGEIIVGKLVLPDYMAPDKVAHKLGVGLYES